MDSLNEGHKFKSEKRSKKDSQGNKKEGLNVSITIVPIGTP